MLNLRVVLIFGEKLYHLYFSFKNISIFIKNKGSSNSKTNKIRPKQQQA